MKKNAVHQTDLLSLTKRLERSIKELNSAIGGSVPNPLAQRRLEKLREKFLSLRVSHGDLFDLLLKIEEGKFLLKTLKEIELQPALCIEIEERLNSLTFFLTQTSCQQNEKVRTNLRKMLSSLQSELEQLAERDESNRPLLRHMLDDFQRIYQKLRKRVYAKPLSDEERVILHKLKDECETLNATFQQDYLIHLKIEEAKFILHDIERMRPLPRNFQPLYNILGIFFGAISGRTLGDKGKSYDETYRRVCENITKLKEEAEQPEPEQNIAAPHVKCGPVTALFRWIKPQHADKKQREYVIKQTSKSLTDLNVFLIQNEIRLANDGDIKIVNAELNEKLQSLKPFEHQDAVRAIFDAAMEYKCARSKRQLPLKALMCQVHEALRKVA